MIIRGMNYVNVENKLEVCTKRETKNCNFQHIFFKLKYSVINGAKLIKCIIPVVGGYLEGTVSQIFYLVILVL